MFVAESVVYTITSLALRLDDSLDNTIDPTARTGFDKVQVSAVLIGVVLPLVVGFLTGRTTSSQAKALMLLAASALTAFITEWANSSNFVWQQALLTLIMTFGTGVVVHLGFYQYRVAPKLQSVGPKLFARQGR